MSNWYVGQKVVCVVDASQWTYRQGRSVTTGWWFWKKTTTINPRGPLKGETCTIDGFDSEGYFFLVGYNKKEAYAPAGFRPLDSLTEQIERIESEGAPVEEPATLAPCS